MLKIAKSLFVIIAVSAIATSATGAYFSSNVAVHNVNFTSGTLVLTDVSEDWQQPVDFGVLKPGDLVRKWVKVQNDGTLPIGALTVSTANVKDTSGLLSQLRGWTYSNIMGLNDKQTGYNNNAAVLLVNAPLLTSGDLLQPDQWMNIQVQFVVPDDLDQTTYQGQSVAFDLVFHAEQVHQ